jgi:hypothetical protein
MCTTEETIKTGINIDTVNESKLNPHITNKDSESIHLNNFTVKGILFNPTSKKVKIDNIVLNIIQLQVIIWAPFTPIFLPKNPETIEPNNGNIIKVKYIFNIL